MLKTQNQIFDWTFGGMGLTGIIIMWHLNWNQFPQNDYKKPFAADSLEQTMQILIKWWTIPIQYHGLTVHKGKTFEDHYYRGIC